MDETRSTCICKPIPGLFVGTMAVAHDRELMKALKVTHVINAAKGLKNPAWALQDGQIRYLSLSLSDSPEENISSAFDECCEFIDLALRNADGAVLVHCVHGISRSATITAAYLVKSRGLQVDDAVALMRQTRPQVRPNEGFVRQLEQYQQALNGASR